MRLKPLSGFVTICACALVPAAHFDNRARAAEADEFRKLISERSSALVTVKSVLKVKMTGFMSGGGDQESENEVTGVMVGPRGLILCSNTQLLGFSGTLNRMMGGMGGMSATPTDLKVLVGDDTEGVEAELLARDSELDLAWVRIKDPGDKTFEYIDFSKGAKPEIGQRVVALRRLGKFFARVSVALEDRIGGMTAKPRELYVPTGSGMGALGMPVFLPDGQPVGVLVTQTPDEEEVEASPMMMLSRMSSFQDSMAGLILPASDVARATARALETVGTQSDSGEGSASGEP